MRYDREMKIMHHMGWSWPDLLSAPPDLVEEIAERIDAEAEWTAKKMKDEKNHG
jgi:hypothetical protein